MGFKESQVRDSLSKSLDKLEDGLSFKQKEKFIPSRLCTKSFIDLVAHDAAGRIVLIEVKKTNAASREAIHEILKYLEAVKNHLGLHEDEIRIFVASVEWSELLVPFSSFVARTTCSVSGFQLSVDSYGNVLTARSVDPIKIENGRIIAPWHEVRYFTDDQGAIRGLREYEAECSGKGIESYVILELHPSPPYPDGISSPKQMSMRNIISGIAGDHFHPHAELPKYQRILYFAMQQLREQEYQELLLPRLEPDSDILEYIADLEGDEKLNAMHEALLDLEPRPECDFFEIGSPAKLNSRLLEDDGWQVHRVHRFGSFKRNATLLSDDVLVGEIAGSRGVTDHSFNRTFDPLDKSQVAEVRRGISQSLSENKAWKKQATTVLDELIEEGISGTVSISIYNPSTSLLTFYLVARNEDGERYIPSYSFRYFDKEREVIVYGCLTWDGSKSTLKNVLTKHYSGSIADMLAPLLWGGHDDKDAKVMRTIGVRYKTFKITISGEERKSFEMSDEGWDDIEEQHPHAALQSLFEENSEFLTEVCNLYAENWQGGILNMMPPNSVFDE